MNYRNKSEAELRYIIRDAAEAAQAMRDVNPAAEGKYLDQVNDASSELYRRERRQREQDRRAARRFASQTRHLVDEASYA